MKESFDFEYHLPNDVTLHCTADIYPGTPPIIHALPENCDPGSADQAEIVEAQLEAENGTMVGFIPGDMFFRPWPSTELISITDHMEETALEQWRDAK